MTPSKNAVAVLVERLVAVHHVAAEVIEVHGRPAPGELGDELDLGTEIEAAVRLAHQVDRLFAEPVAGQQQRFVRLVEQGEAPHPFGPVERRPAIAIQELDQHLGVAGRCEGDAGFGEVLAQFEIVVDLAIEGDDPAAVPVRLVSALVEVDDGEAPVQQQRVAAVGGATAIESAGVGPAPIHQREAALDRVLRYVPGSEISSDAAHRLNSSAREESARRAGPWSQACGPRARFPDRAPVLAGDAARSGPLCRSPCRERGRAPP